MRFIALMEPQTELEETFLELYSSACALLAEEKYKSATILLSKALFSLVDYLIYIEFEKLPKNHSERFRILEKKFPKIYVIVDVIWDKYTDTYTKPSSKESANLLIGSIKEVIENYEKTSQKIKEIIG